MSKYQIVLVSILSILMLIGCGGEAETPLQPTESPSTATIVATTLVPTSTSEPIASSTPTDIPPTPTIAATLAPTSTPEPVVPSRLNLAYGNLPTSLDPHRTSDQFATTVLQFVCQELIGLENEPLLATEWEFSSDNTSVTFFLRQDIQFRDGTPLTSEAVKYSLERLQDPDAELSPLYETFQGVQIEAPDTYTVVFNFDTPRADFLDELNSGYAAILSPSAYESTIATDPVCTGPYYVKDWQPNEYILLTKNEEFNSAPAYYDNQGPAYIDEIKIYLIATHEERFQALLDGIIDTNHINTKEELALIKERSDEFRIDQGAWLGGITYLGFNYDRSPVNELLVRQALAHAIDKNALIDAVLADEFAIPAVSLLSPSTLGYSESLKDVEYGFDLESSRTLLAEAGFTDSNGDGMLERDGKLLKLILLTTTDNIYLDMATLIQTQFAELGVDVEIQQNTRPEISEITPTGEFDLLLYDYNWPYPSALNLFLSTEKIGTTNRVFYSNPDVDVLLAEVAALEADTTNEAIIEEKIIEAQRLIIQDAPWQPILARRVVSAVNVRVVGEKMHETGTMLWHNARIVED